MCVCVLLHEVDSLLGWCAYNKTLLPSGVDVCEEIASLLIVDAMNVFSKSFYP